MTVINSLGKKSVFPLAEKHNTLQLQTRVEKQMLLRSEL